MRPDQRVSSRDVESLAGSQLQSESMAVARMARLAVRLAVERDALLAEAEALRRDRPARDRERLMRAVIRPMATSRGLRYRVHLGCSDLVETREEAERLVEYVVQRANGGAR